MVSVTCWKQNEDFALVTTFELVVIESPVLINAVLDAMGLDAVGTAGFVLENYSESVFFFCSQHRAWKHGESFR